MSNHVCAECADELRRVDINSGVGHAKADWVHANSLVYDGEATGRPAKGWHSVAQGRRAEEAPPRRAIRWWTRVRGTWCGC